MSPSGLLTEMTTCWVRSVLAVVFGNDGALSMLVAAAQGMGGANGDGGGRQSHLFQTLKQLEVARG